MPRNGTGTYTLPAGNPVITGTTISSVTHNNTNNDIAAALTQSVSADGQTPWTGATSLFVGSTVPTATAGDSSTKIASTAFVQNEIVTKSAAGKNRIINSDFRVAQRGTSGTANGAYSLDGWILINSGTAPAWSRVTGSIASPFPDSYGSTLMVTGVAGNTGVNFNQKIESINCSDLAGKSVTVQFWINQNTGSSKTVNIELRYANSTDNFTTTTLIGSSISPSLTSNVFTLVTATFTIPAAATTGLQLSIQFNSALLAGTTVQIGNVQLESGLSATVFERDVYSVALSKCQRYYVRFDTGSSLSGYALSAVSAYLSVTFPTTMRDVTPTITQVGTVVNTTASTGSVTSIIAVDTSGTSALLLANSGALTSGSPAVLSASSGGSFFAFSTEL